ncbi:lysozyme, partial [Escherichia coli EC1862]
KQNAKPS